MYRIRQPHHSQNFLRHRELAKQLVRASSIARTDIVLEIGPGRGILTHELAQHARSVVGIEADPHLAAALTKQLSPQAPTVIFNTDFLTFPLPTGPYKVFSNPPFSITGDILRKLLFSQNPPQDCYLVLQNEAAEKYMPTGHSHTMASVLLYPWWEISIPHQFKRTDFQPVPSVNTSLIRFRLRPQPLLPASLTQTYRDAVVSTFTSSPQAKYHSLTHWLNQQDRPEAAKGSFDRWMEAQSTVSKIHRTRSDPHWKYYKS